MQSFSSLVSFAVLIPSYRSGTVVISQLGRCYELHNALKPAIR
jgi:hypothetical protein